MDLNIPKIVNFHGSVHELFNAKTTGYYPSCPRELFFEKEKSHRFPKDKNGKILMVFSFRGNFLKGLPTLPLVYLKK